MTEDWDAGYYARQMLCITCYGAKFAQEQKKMCVNCGNLASPSSGGEITGHFYCPDCYKSEMNAIAKRTCHVCRRVLEPWEERVYAPDGKMVCKKCYTARGGRFGMKAYSARGPGNEEAKQRKESLMGGLVRNFVRIF